jgi:glycosyltransferase involved in cell wall biosynthesis
MPNRYTMTLFYVYANTNILYIQPYNWDCGPHQSLRALVANLNRTCFSPLVILPSPGAAADDFTQLGAEVHYDPGVQTIPRSLSPGTQSKFWAAAWTSARYLANFIRTRNVRLVHVNSEACWVGGFASRLQNVVSVTHLRGLSVLSPPWVGRITSWVLNSCNQALIAVSDEVKSSFERSGAKPDMLKVIHNGVNIDIFSPLEAQPTLRSELNLRDGERLVGMIANFDPRKGHHDFIRSCLLVQERMPHTQFVIVGNPLDKKYYREIRQRAEQKGLAKAMHFLGARKDIPNILMSLDVVVQPSLTEAGPRVPIEAMAMKRPLVVTDVGGNSEEVVNEQTGIVVPVSDIRALSEAILRLLSDAALSQRLGELGRQRVLNMFTEEAYASKVQQLYEQLLTSHRQ